MLMPPHHYLLPTLHTLRKHILAYADADSDFDAEADADVVLAIR